MLREAGIRVALVTGRSSRIVERGRASCGIATVLQGVPTRPMAMRALCAQAGIEPSAAGFMGDDWPDLPAMRAVGFAAAPPDPRPECCAPRTGCRHGGRRGRRARTRRAAAARAGPLDASLGRFDGRVVLRRPTMGRRAASTAPRRRCRWRCWPRSGCHLPARAAGRPRRGPARGAAVPRAGLLRRAAGAVVDERPGEPTYRLEARRLRHFPDDDTTEFDAPTMVSLDPRGRASPSSPKRALLRGGEEATCRATSSSPARPRRRAAMKRRPTTRSSIRRRPDPHRPAVTLLHGASRWRAWAWNWTIGRGDCG
jgi:hypothetical protein